MLGILLLVNIVRYIFTLIVVTDMGYIDIVKNNDKRSYSRSAITLLTIIIRTLLLIFLC